MIRSFSRSALRGIAMTGAIAAAITGIITVAGMAALSRVWRLALGSARSLWRQHHIITPRRRRSITPRRFITRRRSITTAIRATDCFGQ
jgi:hypothetical protein